MLTVRETLQLAAQLQLPASVDTAGQHAAVDHALQSLGLVKVADTKVGDAKTRGLSGGEKKRLQIACELIASPRLVFAGVLMCILGGNWVYTYTWIHMYTDKIHIMTAYTTCIRLLLFLFPMSKST